MTPRRLLLLLTALVASTAVWAQRTYSPELWVGAHGGATLSRQSFVPSAPQSMLPGVMAGVTVKYTEENHFGLITEVNIQQRGWRENFEEKPFRYSRTLTYIQIPLLTHIYFGNRRYRGYFNAGPEVAYMLGSSISANFDWAHYASVPGFPMKNRTNEQISMAVSNRFDYGISAGLGMEIFVGRRNSLSLESRYYFGIANIFPDTKRDIFNASRGWSIEILAAYSFRLL